MLTSNPLNKASFYYKPMLISLMKKREFIITSAVVLVLLIVTAILLNKNSAPSGFLPVAITGIEGNEVTVLNPGINPIPKPSFIVNNQEINAAGGNLPPNSSTTYALPVQNVENSSISILQNNGQVTVVISNATVQSTTGTQPQNQPPQTQPNQTQPPAFQPPAAQPSSSGFVRQSGTRLTLDGSEYRFVGVNIYGLASDDEYNCGGNPDDPEEYVENIFSILEQKRVNAVRFWAFQSFSHDDFAAIDRVVNAAKRHNIKLIPTLENHWHHCTEGGDKPSTWYSNPSASYGYPLSFRQYVERIVTRYRNETTILMWQLMNEAESGNATALFEFTRDISTLIKSIDQNHLVNPGTLGTGQAGTNDQRYIDLHSLASVDIVEAHDYRREGEPLPGYPWDGNIDEIDTIAADLAVSQQLNKPFFIGEAGINERSNRVQLFQAKMDAAFNNGTSGYLIWDFELEECGGYCFYPGDPLIDLFDRYN